MISVRRVWGLLAGVGVGVVTLASYASKAKAAPIGKAFIETPTYENTTANGGAGVAGTLTVSTATSNEGGAGRAADQGVRGEASGEKAEHFRIGVLGGAGFPRPLSVEAAIKLEKMFMLGLEFGEMPTTNILGVNMGVSAVAIDARLFPFKSSFFIGARAGHQSAVATATYDAGAYGSYSGSMSVDTYFVNPRIGLLWTASWGLTVGADIGVQIPISHTESSSIPSAVSGTSIASTVTSVGNFLGASVIPTVNILQLGMLF
jgi:hypothetical protein